VNRRTALTIVIGAAVLPRLVVLAIERNDLISGLSEKSDRFANTLLASGTYGFMPGRPSANTQPLYGLFLSGLYWVWGRDWLTVGLAQTAMAAATALLVYAIGARVASRGNNGPRSQPLCRGGRPPPHHQQCEQQERERGSAQHRQVAI